MVDESLSPGVLHTDLHELFEGGVVSVIPVPQLVHVRLGLLGYLRHARYIIKSIIS